MTTAYRFAGLPGAAYPSGPAGWDADDARAGDPRHTDTGTDASAGHGQAPRRPAAPGLHWITSSFGGPPSAHALPPATLDQHLSLCRHRHGRLAAVACGAESVHRFIAARFVTTLAVAVLVIGLALLAI